MSDSVSKSKKVTVVCPEIADMDYSFKPSRIQRCICTFVNFEADDYTYVLLGELASFSHMKQTVSYRDAIMV